MPLKEKVPIAILVAIIGAIATIIAAYIGVMPLLRSPEKLPNEKTESKADITKPITLNVPFLVSSYFYPSGWMGDGEICTDCMKFNAGFTNCNRSGDDDGICIQIKYRPESGGKGFAGIYWQYPDRSWGEEPGRKILKATKVTFWARGESGGEIVEFKAGGINNPAKKYQDSFEVAQRIKLKIEWSKYEISLSEQDLSNVIGAFAWVASRDANPEGLIFYLDDIRYE